MKLKDLKTTQAAQLWAYKLKIKYGVKAVCIGVTYDTN